MFSYAVWCIITCATPLLLFAKHHEISQTTKPSNHQTIKPPNHQTTKPSNTPFSAEGWLARREARMAEAGRLRGVYGKCVEELRSPAENVTVPVESFDDGSVKTSVHASKAQFFVEDALVWGEGVVVSHYAPDGTELARLTAQSCVVDRNAKCGWAEGHARLDYGGTSVEGDGVYFSLGEEYVIIASNSCIATTDLKLGGIKL